MHDTRDLADVVHVDLGLDMAHPALHTTPMPAPKTKELPVALRGETYRTVSGPIGLQRGGRGGWHGGPLRSQASVREKLGVVVHEGIDKRDLSPVAPIEKVLDDVPVCAEHLGKEVYGFVHQILHLARVQGAAGGDHVEGRSFLLLPHPGEVQITALLLLLPWLRGCLLAGLFGWTFLCWHLCCWCCRQFLDGGH